MLDTTFNRSVATALKGYSKRITSSLIGKKYMLWKLGQLGGIEVRPGATSLVEPAILGENTNVKFISHYGIIPTAVQGGITAAEVAWKELAGSTGISFMEKFKNSGQATQIVSLWNAVGKQLSDSMKNRFNKSIFSDGLGDDAQELTGLLLAVEDSPFSAYAEIDPNQFPLWANFYFDGGNILHATDGPKNIREGMTKLVNGCRVGGEWPHMIVTTQRVHETWETTVLLPNERYERLQTDEDAVRSGFGENYIFKSVPVFWDEDVLPSIPTPGDNTDGMISLNLNHFKLAFGSEYNFEFTDPVQPDNQAAESVLCVAIGNLICSQRRAQGRVNFATA